MSDRLQARCARGSGNLLPAVAVVSIALLGWAPQQNAVASVAVEPSSLRLAVGEKATLSATVKDANGNVIEAQVFFFSRARRDLRVDTRSGEIEAIAPGEYEVVAIVPEEGARLSLRNLEDQVAVSINVIVPLPPARSVSFENVPAHFYAATAVELEVSALDARGVERSDLDFTFTSSAPEVASVDAHGVLRLHRVGRVTIRATVDEVSDELAIDVAADPVATYALEASAETGRTGDVVHFNVVARDGSGHEVTDLPVRFSVSGDTDSLIRGAGATALVEQDGRFVAERSGTYTVVAFSGKHVASASVSITPRNVGRVVELVGQGRVNDRHTSDLWIWEGADGRDYAVTGTWGAGGQAYFWDVTDPSRITRISEIQVDARTVNDVKVSEDGRIAVISREGASNRRNGLVIIDVENPRNPQILSSFDENLTGGVHNVFIYAQHVYALSAGRRYDIISIEDPTAPHRVGRFELDSPGHSIHDVWVADGIAYSSNWADGLVAVDVGGGGKGGAPNNPVLLGAATYPSGANHAAFPFRSKSAGKFYGIAGDEIFPSGMNTAAGSKPTYAAGWVHFFEWDEWDSPVEVARYQVPEAGTHNLWVDEDNEILYVGFYNGGVRAVDISGELLGDLYRQGREIAAFIPDDPDGYIANAPMVWGPHPYKGNVFFSDWNSGLWAVRITERPLRPIGEPRD